MRRPRLADLSAVERRGRVAQDVPVGGARPVRLGDPLEPYRELLPPPIPSDPRVAGFGPAEDARYARSAAFRSSFSASLLSSSSPPELSCSDVDQLFDLLCRTRHRLREDRADAGGPVLLLGALLLDDDDVSCNT